MNRLSACPRKGTVRRRGTINPALVFLMVVLIGLLAVTLNQARLWAIRVELQNNADATALAAVDALTGDTLLKAFLYQDPSTMPDLLAAVRTDAIQFTQLNPINGATFPLQDNPDNQAGGDIVFGTLDTPRSKTFVIAADVANTTNKALINVNAIEINAQLTKDRGTAPALLFAQFTGQLFQNVRARSAAMLDRDVIGFQPVVSPAIPLAPVGLLADYSKAPVLASWQAQIEQGKAPDNFFFDAANQKFVAGKSDGLPEFTAQLALSPNPAGPANNTVLLNIGTNDIKGINAQLLAGVSPADFQAFQNPFVLDNNNQLVVPGTDQGPAFASKDLQDLQNNLDQLRQQAAVRIWPLYSSFGGGKATVCGFVAGRVVTITPPAGAADSLQFTLQPTMIITHAAVTDATHRGINGVPVVNPYICKAWLVE